MAQISVSSLPPYKECAFRAQKTPKAAKFPQSLNEKHKRKNERIYIPQCTDNEHPLPQRRRQQRSSSRDPHGVAATYGSRWPKEPPHTNYPVSGHKRSTSYTHPMRLHPSYAYSLLAPSTMMSVSLVRGGLFDIITRQTFCQDIWNIGNIPKTANSHPQAWEGVAHPPT